MRRISRKLMGPCILLRNFPANISKHFVFSQVPLSTIAATMKTGINPTTDITIAEYDYKATLFGSSMSLMKFTRLGLIKQDSAVPIRTIHIRFGSFCPNLRTDGTSKKHFIPGDRRTVWHRRCCHRSCTTTAFPGRIRETDSGVVEFRYLSHGR